MTNKTGVRDDRAELRAELKALFDRYDKMLASDAGEMMHKNEVIAALKFALTCL